MSEFKKIEHSGREFYLKVDKTDGAIILQPGAGIVTLSTDTIVRMLDFRRSFVYSEAAMRRRVTSNTIIPTVLEQFIEDSSGDASNLVIISYTLAQKLDMPTLAFKTISLTDGRVKDSLNLPGGVTDQFFRDVSAAGIKPRAAEVSDVKYVKVLPDETAADSKVVYLYNKEYYKLNDEQDDYNKITGEFVNVRKLYEFKTQAKENVLYNLDAPYADEYGEDYERGVYTYTAKDNSHTLTDLVLYNVKRLPEAEKAQANYIYILTREDTENERAKGSMWILKDGEFVAETRTVENVSRLPFIPLATSGTYYILNDEYMKLAGDGSYTNIGEIVEVENLPDTTITQIDPSVIYVLTENMGDKTKGSKWVFDTEKKEFVEFVDVYKEAISNGGGSTP